MTWQLFSPDLPFLNEIKVSQSRNGLLEQMLPYAPALSALFSLVGIIITSIIAAKARAISAEQKKIAEDKLALDVFDKRATGIKGLIALRNLFGNVINKKNAQKSKEKKWDENKIESYINDLSNNFYKNYNDIVMNPIIFGGKNNGLSDDLFEIDKKYCFLYSLVVGSEFFTKETLIVYDKKYQGKEIESEFEKEYQTTSEIQSKIINQLIHICSPKLLQDLQPLSSLNATTSPASHPEPQPTAQEQAQ